MTPEKAALIGVLAGGAITLVGTLLTGVLNIWLQWLQARWLLKNEAKKDLIQKRSVALQNCVQMADFLIASKNASLGPGGQDMWLKIRTANVSNGAFFPPALDDDFSKTIQKVLMMDQLESSVSSIDFSVLERLRKACIKHINEGF